MSIYNYSVFSTSGEEISLREYEGKVILIVNTATTCGFTPQYMELELMYEKYHSQGFEIIDIPCNQFGEQAPTSDEEIKRFCVLNYNTQFPQMKKSEVAGKNELPLYTYLKSQQGFKGFGKGDMANVLDELLIKIDKNYKKTPDVKWNFTKFLVDRAGNVLYRFEPTVSMKEIDLKVKSLL